MDCSTPGFSVLCPSLSPRVCSNSCPLSQWCHPTVLSSVIPFSSCLQSSPESGSFSMDTPCPIVIGWELLLVEKEVLIPWHFQPALNVGRAGSGGQGKGCRCCLLEVCQGSIAVPWHGPQGSGQGTNSTCFPECVQVKFCYLFLGSLPLSGEFSHCPSPNRHQCSTYHSALSIHSTCHTSLAKWPYFGIYSGFHFRGSWGFARLS